MAEGVLLREKICDLIIKNTNPIKAATTICVLLEDEIGLAGNGWFDNDTVTQTAIRQYYEDQCTLTMGEDD